MYFGRIFFGFLAFMAFIIIMVVIFGGGKKQPTPSGPVLKPLPEYASTTAAVSFTTDGIVNGDELHRSIRITVSANQRELDVLQGYNPQVISSKTFTNNQDAYTVFLKAINNSNFLAKQKKTKVSADERGQCPLGFRYILDLNQDGYDLSRSWASTCGTAVGNSAATVSTIRQLFQNQIPNYSTLVSTVNLSATRE